MMHVCPLSDNQNFKNISEIRNIILRCIEFIHQCNECCRPTNMHPKIGQQNDWAVFLKKLAISSKSSILFQNK